MIDLSPALLSVQTAVTAPVAVTESATAPPTSFGQTLGAFLDAHDAALDEPDALPAASGRQALAEDGKTLPDVATGDDETPDAIATPFWFAALLPPLAPAPQDGPKAAANTAAPTVAGVAPVPAQAVDAASLPTTPAPAELSPASVTTNVQGDATPDVAARNRPIPLASTSDTAPTRTPGTSSETAAAILVTTGDAPARTTGPTLANLIADAVARAAPKPTDEAPSTSAAPATPRSDPVGQAIAVSTIPQPAGQVFAAALAFAGSWRERDSQNMRGAQPEATAIFAGAAPVDLRERAVVHATTETGRGALDLTRDSGLQGVIDRIETLRDSASDVADSRDTRIRLIPDALGSIDVAVQQQGDRVHVRFTAEHDATRALIAEAQPRLTELAAARGVRIGDTSVSTQTGSGGNTPQPRTAPAFARAPMAAAPETDIPTDHRLA